MPPKTPEGLHRPGGPSNEHRHRCSFAVCARSRRRLGTHGLSFAPATTAICRICRVNPDASRMPVPGYHLGMAAHSSCALRMVPFGRLRLFYPRSGDLTTHFFPEGSGHAVNHFTVEKLADDSNLLGGRLWVQETSQRAGAYHMSAGATPARALTGLKDSATLAWEAGDLDRRLSRRR